MRRRVVISVERNLVTRVFWRGLLSATVICLVSSLSEYGSLDGGTLPLAIEQSKLLRDKKLEAGARNVAPEKPELVNRHGSTGAGGGVRRYTLPFAPGYAGCDGKSGLGSLASVFSSRLATA